MDSFLPCESELATQLDLVSGILANVTKAQIWRFGHWGLPFFWYWETCNCYHIDYPGLACWMIDTWPSYPHHSKADNEPSTRHVCGTIDSQLITGASMSLTERRAVQLSPSQIGNPQYCEQIIDSHFKPLSFKKLSMQQKPTDAFFLVCLWFYSKGTPYWALSASTWLCKVSGRVQWYLGVRGRVT